MTFIAFGLALFVFCNVADRLRRINWKTARKLIVALQLLQIALALWVIYDVFTVGVGWFQAALLLINLAWLHFTRPDWRFGVPRWIRTQHGDLGPPEIERFR